MVTILLKEVAESKGYRMYHIQKETGLDIGLIRRYWRNETTSVDLRYLARLCKFLNVTPGDLLCYNTHEG